MNNIPDNIKILIREDKKNNGLSLLEISEKYHVAKSTASLICRDVFHYRGRKYATEKENWKAIMDKRKGKPRKRYGNEKRTMYPCRNQCGNMTSHKGGQCLACYRKEVTIHTVRKHYPSDNPELRREKYHRKTYFCKNNCGAKVTRENSFCRKCYNQLLYARAEVKQAEKEKRKKDTEERLRKRFKPANIDVCNSPISPNKRHFWQIDGDNYGTCKYCQKERDFKKLQEIYIPQIIAKAT